MAAQPQRRPVPVPHLGPHIVPVERALKARAEAIQADPRELQTAVAKAARVRGADTDTAPALGAALADVIAGELRALAEELHHW